MSVAGIRIQKPAGEKPELSPDFWIALLTCILSLTAIFFAAVTAAGKFIF